MADPAPILVTRRRFCRVTAVQLPGCTGAARVCIPPGYGTQAASESY